MFDIKDKNLLSAVSGFAAPPVGYAYNIRKNGAGEAQSSTENVSVTSKTDKPGIDIRVKPGAKGEKVYIPVIITKTGVSERVYNDFYIGEGAEVEIIAGCGIHNSGCSESRHDGVHRFFIGKNAKISYVEKHYGEGSGSGGRTLNPEAEVFLEENAVCVMENVQIKGVDSAKRTTRVKLGRNAKFTITERLMTHGSQTADSDIYVELNGEGASAQIISRSVAKNFSEQTFLSRAVGNAPCRAHVQCDSIIMDGAKVRSVPEISANNADAQLVHEAAIGRINSGQLLKLMTLGMTEEEAENVIIEGFLK